MLKKRMTLKEALAEIEELRARLEEAEDGLRAIRSGEVDALVVSGPEGEQVYTLAGAERTYRILVEAMNEGALVLSPEGMIVYCNRTFAAMLDTPIYEILGHPIYDFVAEADVEPLRHMLQNAPHIPARREISLKSSDSDSTPAAVSVGNLDTDDGPAVSAVVTDLTETKRTEAELAQYREHLEELIIERTKELAGVNEELATANEELATTNEELSTINEELHSEIEQRAVVEEALRSSEHQLKAVFDASRDAIIVMDDNGSFISANVAVYSVLGVPSEELIGRNIAEFREIEFRKKKMWAALLQAGGFCGEHMLVRADGSVITVESYCAVDILPSRHLAVIRDITERKKWEEELARARNLAEEKAAQLESFISSLADGVTLFDAEGKAVLMNDAGKAIFGVPPDAQYDDWTRYERYTMDGEPIPVEDAVSFRALRGETIKNMRYRAISPWGKKFIISVSASPVLDSEGRIIGATNVFRDVTNEVEYERQQQELLDREHKIADMLQQALIPPQIPYEIGLFSVAARYIPALREAQVGGDFYDVFELDDNKVGVLIGDVAGKGLRAAIRVAAARYAIRSYAYIDPSPARVMTLTNEALSREGFEAQNMLSAFFAVLDVSDGTMTYACAGHEPPVVCSAYGGIQELAVTGRMLGVISASEYTEHTCKLSEGDTVVMFTDGITEARRKGSILFEKSGVIKHLTQLCGAQPEEIAEALLAAATEHAEGTLQDDVVIVALAFQNNTQT